MFLHQETEPFYADLLSAADGLLWPGEQDLSRLAADQDTLQDALAAGLIPVVTWSLAARSFCGGPVLNH